MPLLCDIIPNTLSILTNVIWSCRKDHPPYATQGNWGLETPYDHFPTKYHTLSQSQVYSNQRIHSHHKIQCRALSMHRGQSRGHFHTCVLSHLHICSFPETSTDPTLGSKGTIWNGQPDIPAAGLQEDVQTG